MDREIVLDTETTGFSPKDGDRMVEIGCVELVNHIPTGQHYHTYLDPQRDMPEGAFRIHGLSQEFLSDKPLFSEVWPAFLEFIEDSTLIIHNAPFDMGFLNAELKAVSAPNLTNSVIDTVQMARAKHPGARVGLDALCKHYGIDNSRRTLHGALLDSEILAEVYLELLGGRQSALNLVDEPDRMISEQLNTVQAAKKRPIPLNQPFTKSDQSSHNQLLETLTGPLIWSKYS